MVLEEGNGISGFIGLDFDGDLEETTVILRGTRFDYIWKFGSPRRFGVELERERLAGGDGLIRNFGCDG